LTLFLLSHLPAIAKYIKNIEQLTASLTKN